MATFTPPTTNDVRYGIPGKRGWNLWRFLSPGPRGVNVYLLTDGTYSEIEQFDTSLVTTVYHGGHSHTITSAEATSLTNAGYGAYIT